jgi:N,N'-diacetyllegionaminate synthase
MLKQNIKKIGVRNSTYLIAEAGINHNGDMTIAKKMIESAAASGANGIKFQTIFPDELFSKNINSELYELSKDWILSKKNHLELQKHCKKNKIDFFSTPFGKKSAKLLQQIKVPIIKIASGEITNHELITYLSKMKIPMLVSTGMTTISEIAEVVEIIKQHNCPFTLLHCVSSYPTLVKDANLSTIQYLKTTFNVPVGFSDHTTGVEVSLAAVALGASVIEKHFTLDKNMPGPDQKLSLDPSEFLELSTKTKLIEKAMGIPRSTIIKSEINFRDNMRKSLGVKSDISSGTIITRPMISLFRPGIGIPPNMIDNIIGRTVKRPIKCGTLLKWDDF